jgi:hypothetical protein
MSHPLVEKLRRAREREVEACGFVFTIRRPTDIEAQRLKVGTSLADLVPFVVGWKNVREMDVVPGGDPHPLPFDAAVCAEWLADRPDLLQPLVEAIVAEYRRHLESLGSAEKN